MSTLSLVFESDRSDLTDRLVKDDARETIIELENYIKRVKGGLENCGSLDVFVDATDPVAASTTITLDTVLATHTVTIGGVTFTASSTPSGEVQFEIDGDDTADAAALVVKSMPTQLLGKL